MSNLDHALRYLDIYGLSVIPIKPDKTPYIKWEEFQKRKPTPDKIKLWWNRWPDAMIGIVAGTISNICVIDCDTPEGEQAVEELLPDSLDIPTVRTPRGGKHLYFRMPDQPIGNKTGVIPGVDIRGEGGYVIAPPSVNGVGKAYQWVEGLGIDDVSLSLLPQECFKRFFIYSSSERSLQNSTSSTNVDRMFNLGRRDNDIFHTAHCLVRGKMEVEEIEQVLNILAESCDPPFPKEEVLAKIKSAIDRARKRERNVAEEVREYILSTTGSFYSTEVARVLHLSTKDEQKNLSIILKRICNEGLIERFGNKNGSWRRVEKDAEPMDWFGCDTKELSLHFPLGVEEHAIITPKSVILLNGVTNAGKTSFALEFARLNYKLMPVTYFNSEMGPARLKRRLSKYPPEIITLETWRDNVTFIERSTAFADVIRPDGLNIIDYLEIFDEFWKTAGMLNDIYRKLNNGIALVLLQKDPAKNTGLGGELIKQKPILVMNLDRGKLTLDKVKEFKTDNNPHGLSQEFKLVNGWKFLPQTEWGKG